MTDNQLNQFPPPPSSPVGGYPEQMAMANPSTATAAPQQAAPAIEIKGVSKFYGSQIGLVNANLTLPSGGIVGLMGPNGCGKTTLMKILAGVMQDYEGEVRLFGQTPGAETKAFTSYLPDSSLLADNLTPRSAIRQYRDFFTDFDSAKAYEMVDFFRLPADRKLSAMSKGMREKLQVALIMSRNARVYLLDEPISGVDPAARDVILRAVISRFNPQAVMLLSTHLISDVEPVVSTAVFMSAGQVFLTGDADQLRRSYQTSLDGLFRGMYR
ncbi:ABC transporter ATP-binding protein [uncultured Varibaculum sp.]|uniref:ABC transporter ATP-binding protein n=1 Tax=uncultured Varibaculum sp. TaxID=413896 RepID=UPI002597BD5E|nr:ABC transporter ATP-binding protein [uncultured Varibaculum sp.]